MGKDETIESSACTQQAHDAAGGPEVQEPDKSSENTRTLEEEGEEKEGSNVGIETLLDKTGRKEGQGAYEDSEKEEAGEKDIEVATDSGHARAKDSAREGKHTGSIPPTPHCLMSDKSTHTLFEHQNQAKAGSVGLPDVNAQELENAGEDPETNEATRKKETPIPGENNSLGKMENAPKPAAADGRVSNAPSRSDKMAGAEEKTEGEQDETENAQIEDSKKEIKGGGQSTDTNAKKGGTKEGEMTGSLSPPDSSSSSTGAATEETRERGKEAMKSDAMAAPDSHNHNPAGSCPTDSDPAPDLNDDAISTTVEQRLTNYCRILGELVPKMIDDRVIGARVTDIFKEIPTIVKPCDHQAIISSGLLPFISDHRNYFDAHPDLYNGFIMPFNQCCGCLNKFVDNALRDAQPKSPGLSFQEQEPENDNERSETEEANNKKGTSVLGDSSIEGGKSNCEISHMSSTNLI